MKSPLHSMTGYATVETKIGDQTVRFEIRSLNHRFLDLKLRLPRDFSKVEPKIRTLLQQAFKRGSIDFKIEYAHHSGESEGNSQYQANLSLAAQYYECLITLQKTLGLTDSIKTQNILSFPDVISKVSGTSRFQTPEELWDQIQSTISDLIKKLHSARNDEGKRITQSLETTITHLEKKIAFLKERRAQCQAEGKEAIGEKIKEIFATHGSKGTDLGALNLDAKRILESRIAQELALLLDRTDIEEELQRFAGHLEGFRETLELGSPAGKKLDFILQELHREINTLGNKAQNFAISEEVVQMKVELEQLREQTMNIE